MNYRDMLKEIKHNLFPRIFEDRVVKGTDLVGVEIGVYTGAHAESMLKHLDIKKMYLIDPYQSYDEYPESKTSWGEGLPIVEEALPIATKKLCVYGPKIEWVFAKSEHAADMIPNDLDFVYIDANHAYEYVIKDIELYWPKIKKGGVLGGHDFYNGFCDNHDGVIKAVIEFVFKNNLMLHTELPDWWMVK